ncbi:MAG: hypothetical protein R2717_04420 [Schumannella sp.]
MRVRVLPRDLAARITNATVATIGWAVGAITVVTAIPVLVETMIRRDRVDEIPVALMLLLIVLFGVIAVWRWRRVEVVLIYLAAGGVTTLGYELVLLNGDPGILADNLYLVNRPTLALVAVGVTATTAVTGILWSAFGLAVATSVPLAASLIAGVPFRPGFGPLMVFFVATLGYLTFAVIQRSIRRKVPNFDALEVETQRLARGEDLSRRTTAAVHDTVLNDLSIILNTTGETQRAHGRAPPGGHGAVAEPSGSRRPPRSRPPTTRTPPCATRSCAWSATSSGAACRSTSRARGAACTSSRPRWAARRRRRSVQPSRTCCGTRAHRSPSSSSSIATST